MKKRVKIALFSLVAVVVLGLVIFGGFVLFFPLKYQTAVRAAESENTVSADLIYAVMKAESNFDEKAISAKGAYGLMQVLPTTAVWVAQDGAVGDFSETDLFVPETNIAIGVKYLKYLLEKFADKNTAICAYNAGEAVVRSWLINEAYSSDGVKLLSIPYAETKAFLAKVLLFQNLYKIRLNVPF